MEDPNPRGGANDFARIEVLFELATLGAGEARVEEGDREGIETGRCLGFINSATKLRKTDSGSPDSPIRGTAELSTSPLVSEAPVPLMDTRILSVLSKDDDEEVFACEIVLGSEEESRSLTGFEASEKNRVLLETASETRFEAVDWSIR